MDFPPMSSAEPAVQPSSPSDSALSPSSSRAVRRYSRSFLLSLRHCLAGPPDLHISTRRQSAALAGNDGAADSLSTRRRSVTHATLSGSALTSYPTDLAAAIASLSHSLSSLNPDNDARNKSTSLGRRASLSGSAVSTSSTTSKTGLDVVTPVPRERTRSLGGDASLTSAPISASISTIANDSSQSSTSHTPTKDDPVIVELAPLLSSTTPQIKSEYRHSDSTIEGIDSSFSKQNSNVTSVTNHLSSDFTPIPIPLGLPGNNNRRLRSVTAPHSALAPFPTPNSRRLHLGATPFSHNNYPHSPLSSPTVNNFGSNSTSSVITTVHQQTLPTISEPDSLGVNDTNIPSSRSSNTIDNASFTPARLRATTTLTKSPVDVRVSSVSQTPTRPVNLSSPFNNNTPLTTSGRRASLSKINHTTSITSNMPSTASSSSCIIPSRPSLSVDSMSYSQSRTGNASNVVSNGAHYIYTPVSPSATTTTTNTFSSLSPTTSSVAKEFGYLQKLSESPRSEKHRALLQAVRVPDQTETLMACFFSENVNKTLQPYLHWLPYLSYAVRLLFIKQLLILGTIYKQFSTMLQALLYSLDEHAITSHDVCDALEDIACDLDNLACTYPELRVLFSNTIVALVRRELLDREQLYCIVEKTRLTDAECSYELAGLLLKRLKAQWPEQKFFNFFTNQLQLYQFLPPEQHSYINQHELIQQFQHFVDVPSLQKLVGISAGY